MGTERKVQQGGGWQRVGEGVGGESGGEGVGGSGGREWVGGCRWQRPQQHVCGLLDSVSGVRALWPLRAVTCMQSLETGTGTVSAGL